MWRNSTTVQKNGLVACVFDKSYGRLHTTGEIKGRSRLEIESGDVLGSVPCNQNCLSVCLGTRGTARGRRARVPRDGVWNLHAVLNGRNRQSGLTARHILALQHSTVYSCLYSSSTIYNLYTTLSHQSEGVASRHRVERVRERGGSACVCRIYAQFSLAPVRLEELATRFT